MRHNRFSGLIILLLRVFIIIAFCCCVITALASHNAINYNATSFGFDTPENYFEMMPNTRTARKGTNPSNGCTTSDGASGTCMSRFNCMRLGGTAKGFCTAFGGICCETNLQCGQTSRLKRTIIRNPSQLPSGDCLYEIESLNSNICQLLVEFDNFDLLQPTLTNEILECTDYMELGDYRLCGNNAQQHLYLPFNTANLINSVPIVFHVPSRWSQTNWRLVVTQLECPAVKRRLNLSFLPFVTDNSLQDARTVLSTHNSDLELLAPPGCDQYFRQSTGTIRTFNYNENSNTFYMQNLKYVICIKATNAATVIEYTARRFSLSMAANGVTGVDGDCFTTTFTAGRREDYLSIPQSHLTNQNIIRPTYYCGTFLNTGTSVTATAPFVMYFASDDFTDNVETGFSIDYRVKSVLG